MPFILIRYFTAQFLRQFLVIFLAVSAIVLLFDFLEIMRKFFTKVGFAEGIALAFLKNLSITERLWGIMLMLSAMLMMMKNTKNMEIVSAKAQGVKTWQILIGPVLASFIIGIFLFSAMNPLSTYLRSLYEKQENLIRKGDETSFHLSDVGLWFKNNNKADEISIFHARAVDIKSGVLRDITIYFFDQNRSFIRRIDAKTAVLKHQNWEIENAQASSFNLNSSKLPFISVPTHITLAQLANSAESPKTISYWRLPKFIKLASDSGFKVDRYNLIWYQLTLSPFYFAVMTFLGAAFSKINNRSVDYYKLLMKGAIAGFTIFFFADLIYAYALSGQLPVILGTCLPIIIAAVVAAIFHLHYEHS